MVNWYEVCTPVVMSAMTTEGAILFVYTEFIKSKTLVGEPYVTEWPVKVKVVTRKFDFTKRLLSETSWFLTLVSFKKSLSFKFKHYEASEHIFNMVIDLIE